ncbi:uncharacterized protein N7446_011805 [Penicillium canescens]|uniref:uncharacterized protein n=1 Tax=Penicillium canescens TaxID=5083 RepID=UPI0026E0F8F5|nr:uncharacterized protein N7446_011805 [Penicillium canescens]KAJ6046971.1 hypothetical protein N7446_011805 [Penicillium canescens]
MILMMIGDVLESSRLAANWLMLTHECVGWAFLVLGLSAVPYLRAHLVCRNRKVILFIRNLIIVTTVLIVPPVIIPDSGSVYTTAVSWTTAFKIIDRLQLRLVSVQESFVSSFYIIQTTKIIRVYPKNKQGTKIFFEPLTVNANCILTDITLVVFQYLDFYFAQILVKPFVYSVKLEPISSGEEESFRFFFVKMALRVLESIVAFNAWKAELEGRSKRLTALAGKLTLRMTPNGKKQVKT